MSHEGHSHDHGTTNQTALKWSFILITVFMVVEVIGGLWTNSLALLSDAGHMLSDSAALGLSFAAIWYGSRSATSSKTYGYRRFEVLAAFINGLALLVIAVYITYEGIQRLMDPPSVVSTGMLIVATIGLIVNIVVARILHSGDNHENLNVRSAFLHVLGDLLGSVGAIAAAILIMLFGWSLADPIASMIVAVLVFVSGLRILRDSVHVLMEGAPEGIDTKQIKEQLLTVEHVKDLHDLHVWSITSDFPALSCHLVVEEGTSQQEALKNANELLHREHGIHHTTIQIDMENRDICEDTICN